MLDNLRKRLAPAMGKLGGAFARVWPEPTGWTAVGLGFSLIAALVFARQGYQAQPMGGLLVLVSGFFDVVDGAVARETGKVSARGSFLDSTLDRLSEVAVFAGVLAGGHADALAVLGALSASLLVSYTRAKGDALGVSLSGVGVGERSERLLVLSVSALLGVVGLGVVIVAVLAAATFAERTVRAAGALGRPSQA